MSFTKSIAGMLMTRRQKEWSIWSTVVQVMHFNVLNTKPVPRSIMILLFSRPSGTCLTADIKKIFEVLPVQMISWSKSLSAQWTFCKIKKKSKQLVSQIQFSVIWTDNMTFLSVLNGFCQFLSECLTVSILLLREIWIAMQNFCQRHEFQI